MPNEYNGDKIVLRDTDSNQMSLPRFFQLATRNSDGSHIAQPSSGLYRNGSTEFHGGWDMGCDGATDVIIRTPAGGTVVYVGGAVGFGPNLVIIKEDNYERYHYFGHLASASVSQGAAVEQGDKVGIAGGYGGSPGAWDPAAYPIHLHYEIMDINFIVSGGWSTDINHVIDPMTAFDEATLPVGWQYGYDPEHPANDYAAAHFNWDYIALDNGASDFGPPSGDIPSDPFFTDKRVYDISMYQSSAKSIELASDNTTGGFIIKWGQANSTSNYWQDSNFLTHLANARAGGIPVGFYFYWEINPDGLSDSDITTLFKAVFQYLTDAGVTPETTSLGLWLDFEGSHSATKVNNDHVVELFNQIGISLGYPVVGFYTYKSFLDANFTIDSIKAYPFWYSRPGVSRTTVDSEIATYGFSAAYLWQDGYPDGGWSPDISYTHQDVDNDTVLTPIPTTGGSGEGSGGGGSGDGGGGSYTLEVLVDVIPPKRIYFSPNPGVFNIDADLQNRQQHIEITTDAIVANIYFTIDGSSPYEYVVDADYTVTYTLSQSAQAYTGPISIYSDTHIRAIAIAQPTASGQPIEILAKGSGTYLYKYRVLAPDWDAEREAYALADIQTHEALFEENMQAFIIEHSEETIEDVVYTVVHLSENTGGESAASEEIPDVKPADAANVPEVEPEPEPEPENP